MLKVYALHNPQEAKLYNEALNIFINNHPYYKVEFLNIFYSGLSNAMAFVYYDELDKPLVAMPFYLRNINTDLDIEDTTTYYDVTSTWGYSGPLFNSNIKEDALASFWQEVDLWYKENNVISEFIRFNPDDNFSMYSGSLIKIMNIVKGQLLDEETIWANYNRKVRKNINKAKRESLHTRIYYKNDITSQVIDDFYNIYVHTMDRTNATAQYYNSKEKLTTFIRSYVDNCAIALTYIEDTPIASEIILLSSDSLFSFIGGTLSDYFNFRPNEILKHDVNLWGIEQGYKYYVLGGGLGKEDGIFNYKKSFFPNDLHPFMVGKKTVNKPMYDTLCKKRGIELTNQENDFFPLYRKP